MTRALTSLLVLPLALGACGLLPLSEEDAKTAWQSTRNALNSEPNADALSAVASYSADCADGGGVQFDSTGSIEEAEITAVNFSYEVTYSDCVRDGVTINGTLTYEGEVLADSTGDSALMRVQESYNGDLTYTGEVNGSCVSDMQGVVEVGATGITISYSGTFCGYEGETFKDVDVDLEYSASSI